MKRLLLIALTAVALFVPSCEPGRRFPTSLGVRSFVMSEFGNEVYDLQNSNEANSFIARCPDGSVWLVVVGWDVSQKKYLVKDKTQVFPETVGLPNIQPEKASQ